MSARAPGADKNRNRKERLNEMKADYHVHYYIDSCAAEEMTFPNIEKKALELGLDEISVLKHHSRRMPNGEAAWVCWKRVKPEEWQRYLDEYAAYRPEKLVIHSGVESELCSEDGEINISDEEAAKIDMIALSRPLYARPCGVENGFPALSRSKLLPAAEPMTKAAASWRAGARRPPPSVRRTP